MSDTKPTASQQTPFELMSLTEFLENPLAIEDLLKELRALRGHYHQSVVLQAEKIQAMEKEREKLIIALKRHEKLIGALESFLLEDDDDEEAPL